MLEMLIPGLFLSLHPSFHLVYKQEFRPSTSSVIKQPPSLTARGADVQQVCDCSPSRRTRQNEAMTGLGLPLAA